MADELKGKPVAALTELAKEVYKDGASPAVKEIGMLLETIAMVPNWLAQPIRDQLILSRRAGAEKLEASIRQAVAEIPEEDIAIPPASLLTPTLIGAVETSEIDELRAMFVSLISSSFNKDSVGSCQPEFPDVLKKMTASDAQLFRAVAYGDLWVLTEGEDQSLEVSRREHHPGAFATANLYNLENRLRLVEKAASGNLYAIVERLEVGSYVRKGIEAILAAGGAGFGDARNLGGIHYKLTPWGAALCDVCLPEISAFRTEAKISPGFPGRPGPFGL
jgi:hypothetical protein